MNSNTVKKTIRQVNSATIDDTWIICDSTSHPGLKFYVNKQTGIKVWNITESEVFTNFYVIILRSLCNIIL